MNERLKALYEYAEKKTSCGLLPAPLRTVAQWNEFQCAFNELVENGKASVLTAETRALFVRFGFDVAPHGIGFVVVK
jgi:hypothetical protein